MFQYIKHVNFQVMQAVVLVLEGPHAPDVKEQALCILGNIADGERAKDQIMANDDVLKKLTDYMTHPAPGLQAAAIFCIGNLVRRGEPGAVERQARLREMGVLTILHQLVSTPDTILFDKYVIHVKLRLSYYYDTFFQGKGCDDTIHGPVNEGCMKYRLILKINFM